MVFELRRVCANLRAQRPMSSRTAASEARRLHAKHGPEADAVWPWLILHSVHTCCISAICSRQKAASCSFCADMVAIFSIMFCGRFPACSCGTGTTP